MGLIGRVLYLGMLGLLAVMFVVGLAVGLKLWAFAALLLGIAVACSGPFVFGQKWKPAQRKPRARPMTRRRR